MPIKLKDCPACGQTDMLRFLRTKVDGKPKFIRVSCECGCDGPVKYEKVDAVRAWDAMQRPSIVPFHLSR